MSFSFQASVATITENARVFLSFFGQSWPISLNGYVWLDKRAPGTLGGGHEARTHEQ